MSNISANVSEDIPTPIVSVDPANHDIIWANQAAQEWIGTSLRSMMRGSLRNIFKDIDGILVAVKRCGEALAPVSLYDYVIKRERRADTKCNITVFPSGTHVAIMFRPHTKHPNATLTGGQATSAMGRMLAHEIKNPLAGIDGAAQLLRDDVSSKEGKDLIDLIRSEINRIRRLADRMETLGDRDPENLRPINIHEILRDARRIVEAASPETLIFTEHYDPSLPEAFGDSDTLMQAILNLIKNAAESIEQSGVGGEIKLETSFRSGVTRYVPGQAQRQQLPIEIRIIDDGPGIDDTVRNRLFEPFITNKPTGQGLGLALVSKIAAAHGGLVEIHSQPSSTVFSLLLPAPNKENF